MKKIAYQLLDKTMFTFLDLLKRKSLESALAEGALVVNFVFNELEILLRNLAVPIAMSYQIAKAALN